MRLTLTLALLLSLTACLQKQADGTYRIKDPQHDGSKKAREDILKLGKTEPAQKIKQGGREIAQGVKEGAGAIAEKTGEKLQKIGREAQGTAKSKTSH